MATQGVYPGAVVASRSVVPRRGFALGAVVPAVWGWARAHLDVMVVLGILVVVGVAHGVNMFHFPYYEDDEGTYMSQAWAIVREGRLAPYTYWYDHAPGGWMQLAVWALVSGGFHTFGASVASGRVFMWVLLLVSALLVYGIGRRITGSMLVGTLAALLCALTAYGGYFQRRVLLDNITTPWMLLSIFLLLSPRVTLQKVWLSALALSVSVLSKEVTAFLVPAMGYLLLVRTDPRQRLFAVIGWVGILGSVLSLYVLMAVLNGELFPTGSLLGGTANHVSLLGSLSYQAGRSKDGGVFDPHSAFWLVAHGWIRDEPLLVVGGTASAVISVLLLRWQRLVGILGLLTLSLWLFLARGGEVIEFYLVPLLPLLALNLSLVLWVAWQGVGHLGRRWPGWLRRRSGLLRLVSAVACLGGLVLGYLSPDRGFATDHTLLWTSTQADAQQQALSWVEAHVPPQRRVVMDNYAYTDLHDGSSHGAVFGRADYYWKLDQDPAIEKTVYHDHWWAGDYLLYTIQMHTDLMQAQLPLTAAMYRHSVLLAHFDTGGWPVEVRAVVRPGASAPDTQLPAAKQLVFAGASSTVREHTVISLVNGNVRPASVQLAFYFSDGTVVRRGVSVDASSRRTIAVSGIQPHSGSFGLVVQTDQPIAAYLIRRQSGAGAGTLLASQPLAAAWQVTWDSGATPLPASLPVLNTDPNHSAHLWVQFQTAGSSAFSAFAAVVPPHSLSLLKPLPARAVQVRITADRPVAVQATAPGIAGATAVTVPASGAVLRYQTLADAGCAAALTRSSSGAAAHLLVAHCATDAQMHRFVGERLRPLIGDQRVVPQVELAGSPGNSGVGSVWFGETSGRAG